MEGNRTPSAAETSHLTRKGLQKKRRVRSVTGCLVCRKRRVKCDEQLPTCGQCLKHPHRVCDYGLLPLPARTSSHDQPMNARTDWPVADQVGDTWPFLDDWIAGLLNDPVDIPAFVSNTADIGPLLPAPGLTPDWQDLQTLLAADVDNSKETPTDGWIPPRQTSPHIPVVSHVGTSTAHASLTQPRVDSPLPSTQSDALADNILEAVRASLPSLSALLAPHTALVRTAFRNSSRDPESRLLAVATTLISMRQQSGPRFAQPSEVFRSLIDYLRAKTDSEVTGKLGATGFFLILLEMIERRPGLWREHCHLMVERKIERGGPAWMLGVGSPLPGYTGEALTVRQPLVLAMQVEITAIVELWACLTDGTSPLLLLSTRQPWLISSRLVQQSLSPTMPDAVRVLLGIPRALIPTFARIVGLISRRNASSNQPAEILDEIEYEAITIHNELLLTWQKRLEKLSGDRAIWYGARLCRHALIILLMQKVQLVSTSSPRLATHVQALFQLCEDAAEELGHLSGWLWFILIAGCASSDSVQRQGFIRFFSMAKSPVGELDNSEAATKIINLVHAHHDLGDPGFHIREALLNDPTLDILTM